MGASERAKWRARDAEAGGNGGTARARAGVVERRGQRAGCEGGSQGSLRCALLSALSLRCRAPFDLARWPCCAALRSLHAAVRAVAWAVDGLIMTLRRGEACCGSAAVAWTAAQHDPSARRAARRGEQPLAQSNDASEEGAERGADTARRRTRGAHSRTHGDEHSSGSTPSQHTRWHLADTDGDSAATTATSGSDASLCAAITALPRCAQRRASHSQRRSVMDRSSTSPWSSVLWSRWIAWRGARWCRGAAAL